MRLGIISVTKHGMWSDVRLLREKRRGHTRGALTRRTLAVRARRALRPQARRDRALGAGNSRAGRRDAHRARARMRLRPAARARPVRSAERRAPGEERAALARAACSAPPEGRRRARGVKAPRFDPYAILEALEGRRVSYVV